MLSINILPEKSQPSAKVCAGCRQHLPIADFYFHKPGLREARCKKCICKRRADALAKSPEQQQRRRESSAAVYLDPERKKKKLADGKVWREQHPDIKAYMRTAALKSYHRHHERNKEKQRLKYQSDPEAGRRQRVIANYKIYGITEQDFLEMERVQGGVCAICRRPERRKVRGRVTRLSVDHCHKTGRVRGLLCAHCNSKLSLVEQLVDHMGVDLLIERLRQYLGV